MAVDVSDPVNPVFAGCFGDDGYNHDAQCIVYNGPDTQHVGQEVWHVLTCKEEHQE